MGAGVDGIEVWAPDGLPEVAEGTDLAALVAGVVDLRDGDVVVVTSKVVSKAEGRVRRGTREEALAEETDRVVARRGTTTIVRNRLGLTMAAAGIDASNVEPGSIVLLPLDPDASARALRARLVDLTGARVGVVVTDTAGRAWRAGQTDLAIGAAGVRVSEDFAGRRDPHGNDLVVTLTALVDEIASAAELTQGKLGRRPVAVVRGLGHLVTPLGQDGPGAASLVRPEGADLFGYGAREAVLRALLGREEDRVAFGAAVPPSELVAVLARLDPAIGHPPLDPGDDASATGPLEVRTVADRTSVEALVFAHGWQVTAWDVRQDTVRAQLRPTST